MDTGNRMRDKESRMIRIILITFIVMILLRTQVFATQVWPERGSGTLDDPYQISRASDFLQLANYVNQGDSFEGQYFILTDDIDLSSISNAESNKSFVCIGKNGAIPFAGHLDGAAEDGTIHTISGLYINSTGGYCGLFGSLTGTVKNLNVSGDVSGTDFVGGIVGYNMGTIENCSFIKEGENTSAVSGNSYVGGIAGYVGPGGSVDGCNCDATVSGIGRAVGGIAGWVNGIPEAADVETALQNAGDLCNADGVIENCRFQGSVSYQGQSHAQTSYDSAKKEFLLSYQNSMYGGVAGLVTGGQLLACENFGQVSGDVITGGVAGMLSDSVAEECKNPVATTGKLITGGISGYLKNGELRNCGNASEYESRPQVTGINVTGGFAGYADKDSVIVHMDQQNGIGKTVNHADVSGSGEIMGGFVGFSDCDLRNLENEAKISGGNTGSFAGGIVGFANGNIASCSGIGSVSADSFVGGIAGQANSELSFCDSQCAQIRAMRYAGGIAGSSQGVISGCSTTEGGKIIGGLEKKPGQYIGGIAGTVAMIQDSANHADVENTGSYTGGIAGEALASLSGCENFAWVRGEKGFQGGIAGKASGGINECKNHGGVETNNSSVENIGGIAGEADCTIVNCINDARIVGGSKTGGIAGSSKGEIRDCTNEAVVKDYSTMCDYTGGIVGLTDDSVIGCTNNGDVIGYNATAGIAGYSNGIIRECKNAEEATVSGVSNHIGGIVGVLDAGRVELSKNAGSVSGSGAMMGGIAGLCVDGVIADTTNAITGTVYGTGLQHNIGGITGCCKGNSEISDSRNEGGVSGYRMVGGIAGTCEEQSSINRSFNSGSVIGAENKNCAEGLKRKEGIFVVEITATNSESIECIGGIVGCLGKEKSEENPDPRNSKLTGCKNTGTVSGETWTGGIAGRCFGEITNCKNCVEITAQNKFTGGITGFTQHDAYVARCTNEGSLKVPENSYSISYFGGITGQCEGTIENCVNEGEVIGHAGQSIGGIAGKCSGGSISYCTNWGKASSYGVHIAGIVGLINSKAKVTGCVNEGMVKGGYDRFSDVTVGCGGIVGMIADWSVVKDCINRGKIGDVDSSGTYPYGRMKGAILGGIAGGASKGKVENCTNYGKIYGPYVGGIVGADQGSNVINCTNNGDVQGYCVAGGIVGDGRDLCADFEVTGCINNGTISGFPEEIDQKGVVYAYEAAGIVAYCKCPVNHCKNTGDVIGYGWATGGIAGSFEDPIEYCQNTGKVKGVQFVGGIAGHAAYYSKGLLLNQCANSGTIIGDNTYLVHIRVDCVGGILGYGSKSYTMLTVSDCYNTGIVYGTHSVGGLISESDAQKGTKILNCYCKAPFRGTESTLLGIDCEKKYKCGAIYSRIDNLKSCDFHRNYWYAGCSTMAVGGSVVMSAGSQYDYFAYENSFGVKEQFVGWDFDSIWEIRDEIPHLRFENAKGSNGIPGSTKVAYCGGSGSTIDTNGTVRIETAEELRAFSESVNNGSTYKDSLVLLCNDIDLEGETFVPIGSFKNEDYYDYDSRHPFEGTFDGQGHRISNLKVDAGTKPAGLFGYLGDFGVIKNVAVQGEVTGSGSFVGGIVALCDDDAILDRCAFVGTVHGTGTDKNGKVGGIAGVHYSRMTGSFTNCYHEGEVTADTGFAGGIAGHARNLMCCIHYDGKVRGGRVEQMDIDEAVFLKSYRSHGGIVGLISTPAKEEYFKYCYCPGSAAEGRLVGYLSSASTIDADVNKIFWDDQMKYMASFISPWGDGFDFNTVWIMGQEHPLLFNQCITVVLDPNGGKQDMQTVVLGAKEKLPSNSFTKENCIFAGWNTKKDGSGEAYSDMATVDQSGTLYAQWTPDPNAAVTIRLLSNGGKTTSLNTQISLSKKPQTNITLPACEFKREGYTFAGWNTRANGTGEAYADHAQYSVKGDAQLYAQWKQENVTVTFVNENRSGLLATQTVPAGKMPVYNGPKPTKEGNDSVSYVFAGWTPKLSVATKSTVYEAVFLEKTGGSYAITINGGTAKAGTETITAAKEDTDILISADAPEEGKEFDCWTSDEVTFVNATALNTLFTMPGQDVKITANYKNTTYNVTLNTDGGRIISGDLNTYTYGIGATLPTEVKKEGYLFNGWYDGETLVTSIGADETGNKTYKAGWKADEKYVRINAGDGMQVIAASSDKQKTEDKMEIVVVVADEGYYFPSGYTAESNGILTTVIDENTIQVSGSPTSDVILNLPPATAKTAEIIPNAILNMTGEDTGILSGLEKGASYKISFKPDDDTAQVTVSPTSFAVESEGESVSVSGLAAGTLSLVRQGSSSIKVDSRPQTFSISDGIKMMGYEKTDCSAKDAKDGTITVAGCSIEYRKAGADTYTKVEAGEEEEDQECVITGLAPGKYEIRYAASGEKLPSESVELEIKIALQPLVTITDWAYQTEPSEPQLSGNAGEGDCRFVYSLKGDENYSDTVPTQVGEYTVKAMIEETDAYAEGQATADFKITKAQIPANAPAEQMSVEQSIQTVGDAELPENWQWDPADADQAITTQPVRAKAVYAGEDAGCFETETVTVQLTKQTCTHATLKSVEKKEATCMQTGYNAYWMCEACGEKFADANGKTRMTEEEWIIKPLGHSYGVPVYTWSEDGRSCKAEAVCERDESHILSEQAIVTEEIILAATQNTKGKTTYTATFNNSMFETQTRTMEDIPSLSHVHQLKEVAAKQATCAEEGHIAYWMCEDCGKLFADDQGKKEIPGKDTITAKTDAHAQAEAVRENVIEATCETDGSFDEVIYCSVCKKELSRKKKIVSTTGHDWDIWVLVKEPTETEKGLYKRICKQDATHFQTREIPAIGHIHEIGFVNSVSANCIEDGMKEHYHCSKCELLFADEKDKNVILDESEYVTRRLGHDYVEVEGSAKEPGCEENGKYADQKCERCGNIVSGNSIPALGHVYGEPVYEWSRDGKKCTAKAVCERDTTHILSEEAIVSAEITQAATEETMGKTTYTAVFKNPMFLSQTKTLEDVQKADHKHVMKKTAAMAATCKEAGNIEYYTCESCGRIFADADGKKELTSSETVVAKTDKHTPGVAVKEKEIAATADTDGSYELVVKCSVCGKELSREKKSIPATGNGQKDVSVDKGKTFTDQNSGAQVVVTSDKKESPTATYQKTVKKKAKSVIVPDVVKESGQSFKITEIAKNAFAGAAATKVTVGKNVKNIKPGAFNKSKVNTVVVKSKKLTKNGIRKAFKGAKSDTIILKVRVGNKAVNKKYVKKYKKIFTKKITGKIVIFK